jgi:urea transport system permease protein
LRKVIVVKGIPMKNCIRILALIGAVLAMLLSPQSALAKQFGFEHDVAAMAAAKKTRDKETIIVRLAASDDPRALQVIQALQAGELYYTKSDKVLVYAQRQDAKMHISDVLSADDLGLVKKSTLKKVSINNKLRNQMRDLLAERMLLHKDSVIRLKAARDLSKNINVKNNVIIERSLATETDPRVIEALNNASALIGLLSGLEADRLLAIAKLDGSSSQLAMAKLAGIVAVDDSGVYSEASEKVRVAAAAQLKKMKGSAEFFRFLENLFFGVSYGSVLLLAAVGLAITFGVMGVINMAHGEMIMLGAYTTYVVQLIMPNFIEYSLLVAIPAAFLVSGAMGVLIERTVIRHLYGRPLETLLATFGISLVLQQLVRSVFSPLNQSVITPEWLSGSMEINGFLSLTYNRLYIIVFSVIVLLALIFILKKTFVGLQMRAVTQNRAMANSMGIRAGWVDALTFGLGSGIAGIAGVALSQLTNVGPNLGQAYIIDSFMVVVFGGVGNLFGTFFAALSLGIANKFIEPVAGAVLAKIIVLIFIVLFIQWRPRGLFAIKGRFVED